MDSEIEIIQIVGCKHNLNNMIFNFCQTKGFSQNIWPVVLAFEGGLTWKFVRPTTIAEWSQERPWLGPWTTCYTQIQMQLARQCPEFKQTNNGNHEIYLSPAT